MNSSCFWYFIGGGIPNSNGGGFAITLDSQNYPVVAGQFERFDHVCGLFVRRYKYGARNSVDHGGQYLTGVRLPTVNAITVSPIGDIYTTGGIATPGPNDPVNRTNICVQLLTIRWSQTVAGPEWVRVYGSISGRFSEGWAVTVAPNGNILVGGDLNATVDRDYAHYFTVNNPVYLTYRERAQGICLRYTPVDHVIRYDTVQSGCIRALRGLQSGKVMWAGGQQNDPVNFYPPDMSAGLFGVNGGSAFLFWGSGAPDFALAMDAPNGGEDGDLWMTGYFNNSIEMAQFQFAPTAQPDVYLYPHGQIYRHGFLYIPGCQTQCPYQQYGQSNYPCNTMIDPCRKRPPYRFLPVATSRRSFEGRSS